MYGTKIHQPGFISEFITSKHLLEIHTNITTPDKIGYVITINSVIVEICPAKYLEEALHRVKTMFNIILTTQYTGKS